jgi:hypothetical protein
MDDARLTSMWSLTKNGKILMSVPRIAFIRSVLMNHNYHHRGQLSVYLRMLDVPGRGLPRRLLRTSLIVNLADDFEAPGRGLGGNTNAAHWHASRLAVRPPKTLKTYPRGA